MMNRAIDAIEGAIVRILVVMMLVAVIAAMVNLVWVFAMDLVTLPFDALSTPEILDLFGAFLIVLIGQELQDTMRLYATRRTSTSRLSCSWP